MRSSDPEEEGIQAYRAPAESAPRVEPRGDEEDAPSIARERSTTFFGRQVRARRGLPVLPILLASAGVAAAALSYPFQSVELCLGALAPVALALVLFLTQPPLLVLHFSEEGIRFAPSEYFLPYGRIQEVFAPQRRTTARFPILLLCDGGHLVLSKLEADAEDLYQFLITQPLGRPAIPDDIGVVFDQFLRQQLAVHGPDKITVYRRPQWTQRRTLQTSWRDNAWTRAALAFIAVGVCWLAAFAGFRSRPSMLFLLPTGIGALALGMILALAGLIQRFQEGGPGKLRGAMLVITPTGLALSQGDLQGELRWREIRKLTLQKNFIGRAGTTAGAGVLITVQGAALIIADIYHWPAEHIDWLIRKHAGLESV